jgi:DNA-binding GntR family transcriptional regulator
MSWQDRSDRIDHHGPETVWSQVAADLRHDIESGELPSGTKLPSEPELAEIYGVARVTIRTAIGSLKEAGLVVVTVGRGTFVARKA